MMRRVSAQERNRHDNDGDLPPGWIRAARDVPHDCVVKHITVEGRTLILRFEADIARHGSIRHSRPNASSLTMRFHMIGEDACEVYRWCKRIPRIGRTKCWMLATVSALAGKDQVYLTHRVGECSVVITLADAFVNVQDDCIDMIWSE